MNDQSATNTRARPAYDEAFDERGHPRSPYLLLAKRLGWDPLHPPRRVVQQLTRQPLGDDHRMLPIPLALADSEYRTQLQAGLAQRALVLQKFFADVVLGEGDFLTSGSDLTIELFDEILTSEYTSLSEIREYWHGHNRNDIRFVYGPDAARSPDGQWVVLEDNVGCIGGCADAYFVLDAYTRAVGLPRQPPSTADLSAAIARWLSSLGLRPFDPGVVAILSDGNYLDNHLPLQFHEDERRASLVQQLGVQVVDDTRFQRLFQTQNTSPVKAIINIGVPSSQTWTLQLETAFARQHLPLLNAPGTSILGNKALLPFVSQMIEFYTGEAPLLESPASRLLTDGRLPTPLDSWVVKTAAGCQGSGVSILNAQNPADLSQLQRTLEDSWPTEAAVAQRHVALSLLWTVGPSGESSYRVEVRSIAYILGWEDVLVGEQALGKLAPDDHPGRLNNVAYDGSYAPVIRVQTSKDRG